MIRDNSHTGLLGYLLDFYINSGKQELALAYEGRVNENLMNVFGDLLADHLIPVHENSITGDIYHELIDNSEYHNKEANGDGTLNPQKVLLVSHNSNYIQFAFGNLIENEKIFDLSKSLDEINSLKVKELDKLITANEGDKKEKGSRVMRTGFINIKKRTGKNLESHFLPYNKSHSWFLIITHLSKN